MSPGPLITVDGPGGIGKSTAVTAARAALQAAGHHVHATTQPSTSPFGIALRSVAETMHGRALALAVAADRLHQQETEVRPHRAAGHTVLLDRYLPSTLVLQRADGVAVDDLLSFNEGIDVPDLAVILVAAPDTVLARLERRGTRHRFETDPESTRRELELYREAVLILEAIGYPLVTIDATSLSPDQVAEAITRVAPAPAATLPRTFTSRPS